jgi:hypothetical protein
MAMALLPLPVHASSVLLLASRTGGAYEGVIEAIRTEVGRSAGLRVQYLTGNVSTWKLAALPRAVFAVGHMSDAVGILIEAAYRHLYSILSS